MPSGSRTATRLFLFLIFLKRLAQLLDRDGLFFRREDDLAREDDGHRAGRRLQEVVHRAAEARLDVFYRRREIRPDLRGTLDAERLDRMADEAAGLDEPRARPGLHPRLLGDLFRRLRIRARRAGTVVGGDGRLAPGERE